MSDVIIGSCQIKPNASFTKKGKYLLDKPTSAMSKAILHIKFNWKFLLGVVSRNHQGVPQVTYQIVTVSKHSKLYDEDLSVIIFDELKYMFKQENQDHVLTTFWIGSPNRDISDIDLQVCIYQLLDKYRVFDNMITQYDEVNNIERGRSLHNTTYWYSLLELYELQE